jgi:exocyst complex component 4
MVGHSFNLPVLVLPPRLQTGPDAFFPDPGWKRLSNRPLVKAATELLALVNSLCAMQQTTPFHRDNYSRLILGVIIQFYQRCSDRFRDLVSTSASSNMTTPSTPKLGGSEETHVSVAARWAQKLEVAACVSALYSLPVIPDAL